MVLITGASKGIGLKVVEKYLASGETVVATDREIENLNKYSDSHRIHWLKMDVTNRTEVKRVIDKVESEIGEINIFVNVAGIFKSCPVEDTTIEEWTKIFEVNTTGVFNVTQAVSDRMKSRKKGSIIVVSSNASKISTSWHWERMPRQKQRPPCIQNALHWSCQNMVFVAILYLQGQQIQICRNSYGMDRK